MKLVVVAHSYPALYETFVRRQASALDAIVVCEIFNRRLYQDLGLNNQILEVGERKGLNRLTSRAFTKIGLYRENYSSDQRQLLARYVKEVRADAVIAHFGPNAIKILPICSEQRLPLFVHFHGHDASEMLSISGYRRQISQVIRRAAGIIVVSPEMRMRLQELGATDEQIALIPYGVNTDQFHPRGPSDMSKCTFLAVGRMVHKKAPLNTIRAFEACADVCEFVRLVFVGGGYLFDKVQVYTKASRHRDRITLTGPLPHNDVQHHLGRADVFVQHSVTDDKGNTEGWPNTIAEAAASGLPIVSTKHAGITTQVIDGITGYLVDEHDIDGMAQRMIQLARSPGFRRSFGEASRDHIRRTGDFSKTLADLKKFLANRVEHADLSTEKPADDYSAKIRFDP